jgi:ZIP family zinc transporter
MNWFYLLDPVYQTLVATTGTWLLTALGATFVLFTARVSQAYLDASLGVAAGAMMFVVAEQLIPESQRHGHVDLATMGVIVGFALMMMLDVGLA